MSYSKFGRISKEDKNNIYNNVNKNITPIDTSARDIAFEADAAKAIRKSEERDMMMNQQIDTSTKIIL